MSQRTGSPTSNPEDETEQPTSIRSTMKGLLTSVRAKVSGRGVTILPSKHSPSKGTPWEACRKQRRTTEPEGWPYPFSVLEAIQCARNGLYTDLDVKAFFSWAMWHKAGSQVPVKRIVRGAEKAWADPRFRFAIIVNRFGLPEWTMELDMDALDTTFFLLRMREDPTSVGLTQARRLLKHDPWFAARLAELKEPLPDPPNANPPRLDPVNPWKEAKNG